jgi:chromosomal replication initiator protein
MMASVQPIELPSRTRVSHRPTTQIQELVAVSYGLHPQCMTARWRGYRHVAWVRQIAMYLTRQITHRSMPAIGEAFGGRDHTTVLHAIRRVEQRMKDDPIIAADVNILRKALTK